MGWSVGLLYRQQQHHHKYLYSRPLVHPFIHTLTYLLNILILLYILSSSEPTGLLGEYLIEHGADDTVENVEGLTCYDGVSGAN